MIGRSFTKKYVFRQKLMVEFQIRTIQNFEKSLETLLTLSETRKGSWSESEAAY